MNDCTVLVVQYVLEWKLHMTKVYPKVSAPDRKEGDFIRLND